jgi:TPR repeat protein
MPVTGRVLLSLALLFTACVPGERHEESAPRRASPGAGTAASRPAGRVTFGALVHDLPPRERRALEPPPAGGVLVGEVITLGPAARAGLRPRDVIVALDGTAVKNPCDLFKRLAGKKAGQSVAFSMQRRNATFDAAVVLDEPVPLYTLACDTGDAAGCMLLAWENKRTGNAVDLFKKACDLGLPDGCAAAGKAYFDGEGISQDTRQSLALFERGCLQGSASACVAEAFQYAVGRGVPQDDVRATERYLKACDGGDPSGCYNLGLMAETGRGTDQDFTRAVTAYTEGCDGGSYLACTNLGFLVENGRGTPADEAKAAGYYRRACDGDGCGDRDAKGCLNLGICALHGRGIPEDPARAVQLFHQACDGGEADACSRLKAQ